MADNLVNNSIEKLDFQLYIDKYLIPILENRWIVILCTLAGFLIALPLCLLVKPEYSSSATIQVEAPRANMVSKVTNKITTQTGSKSYVLGVSEKMKSASFMNEVLKVIPEALRKDLQIPTEIRKQILAGLSERFSFFSEQESDKGNKTGSLLSSLRKRVSIRTRSDRGMIQVLGRTFSAELAPVLVNSYLDVLTAINLEENKRYIKRELDFSKKQRRDYLVQFKQAEAKLIKFKKEYEIPPSLTSVTDPELQSQLEVMQNKVITARERYERLDDIVLELNRKAQAIVNNIQILNTPQIPLRPAQDSRIKMLLFGLVAGAAAGIAPILITDYVRGTIRHERDILAAIDAPIVGHIPFIE